MPLLDLSELMSDPDLADVITVIRNVETVNEQGDSVLTKSYLHDISAVVIPNSGQQLMMLDDGSRISDAITVYSKTKLMAATNTRSADRVIWNCQIYMVKLSKDYGRFGEGFYVANCEMLGEDPGQVLEERP